MFVAKLGRAIFKLLDSVLRLSIVKLPVKFGTLAPYCDVPCGLLAFGISPEFRFLVVGLMQCTWLMQQQRSEVVLRPDQIQREQ